MTGGTLKQRLNFDTSLFEERLEIYELREICAKCPEVFHLGTSGVSPRHIPDRDEMSSLRVYSH